MKLDIPHFSQFLDVEDLYWMPRSCAVMCLKMVGEFYEKEIPTGLELIKDIEAKGGYGPSGWYHDALVAKAKELGLEAFRKEKMDREEDVQTLVDCLRRGEPVIISAVKYILGQTKFHMVVLTGFEETEIAKEDGEPVKILNGFYYHDPETLDHEKGSHLFVAAEIFRKEWRRMAVFVTK